MKKKLLTDNSNLILRIFIFFKLKTSCLKQTDTPLYTYIIYIQLKVKARMYFYIQNFTFMLAKRFAFESRVERCIYLQEINYMGTP